MNAATALNFVQNSPKAKQIRTDLKITVKEVSGTNIYDAVFHLSFASEAGHVNNLGLLHANVATMCYMNLLTDDAVVETPMGQLMKAIYHSTTFKQLRALEGQTFSVKGDDEQPEGEATEDSAA